MSKKNKDIEVRIEEGTRKLNDEEKAVHTVSIGKKKAGEILEESSRRYVVFIEGEQPAYVKSFEDGYETVIRHWNLHQS